MRRIALTAMVLAVWSMVPTGSAAGPEPGVPLSIDGAQATRIVHTPSETGRLAVIAGSTLYEFDGADWQPIGNDVPEGQVAWAGNESGLVLVGDHGPCMRGGPALGLSRSDDGGSSWTTIDGASDLRPLAIWEDSGLALAASCTGLQLSLDRGLTWAPVPGIEPGWEITSFADVADTTAGPVVLVGLTGEGGTSYLRRIDFTNPDVPMVSADLRTYYAIGGLAGTGETYLLATMDGVWVTRDAGVTWERMAEGLDSVVLEQDPAIYGLPENFDPAAVGLFSVALMPGERGGALIGAIDGLYLGTLAFDRFTKVPGTSGRVEEVVVEDAGTLVVYRMGDTVYTVTLPE